MKIAGVLLIVFSAASFGFRYAWNVRRRCDLIGQLLLALRLLKSELSAHGTPLPQAFGFLAAATSGSTAAYFSAAAKEMNKNRWMTPDRGLRLAESQLKELTGEDPVRQVLHDLGAGLGRFDLEGQLGGIGCAVARMEQFQKEAEAEKSLRCKTYRALGICAGLALAILLV